MGKMIIYYSKLQFYFNLHKAASKPSPLLTYSKSVSTHADSTFSTQTKWQKGLRQEMRSLHKVPPTTEPPRSPGGYGGVVDVGVVTGDEMVVSSVE